MNKAISEYMKTIGKKGGDKTKQLHPDHHKNAGKLGALTRWGVSKLGDTGTPQDDDKKTSNKNTNAGEKRRA